MEADDLLNMLLLMSRVHLGRRGSAFLDTLPETEFVGLGEEKWVVISKVRPSAMDFTDRQALKVVYCRRYKTGIRCMSKTCMNRNTPFRAKQASDPSCPVIEKFIFITIRASG